MHAVQVHFYLLYLKRTATIVNNYSFILAIVYLRMCEQRILKIMHAGLYISVHVW